MIEWEYQLLIYKILFSYFKRIIFLNPISIILCKQVLLAMHIKFYLKTYFILETCLITDTEHCLEQLKNIGICLNCFEWNLQRIWIKPEIRKRKKKRNKERRRRAEGSHSGRAANQAHGPPGLLTEAVRWPPFTHWPPGPTCHPHPLDNLSLPRKAPATAVRSRPKP
jgi:hypothetical protein